MRNSRLLILVALSGLLLSTGCSSLSKSFGVGKYPPDEFAIVTKAPLVIPPDFSLRPPEPGELRPQDEDASARARSALFGELDSEHEGAVLSDAERLLAIMAGARSADPAIRHILNAESGGILDKSDSFTENVLFWRGKPSKEAPSDPLDPEKEEERLRYWELVRAVVGDTPVEIRHEKALNLPGVR